VTIDIFFPFRFLAFKERADTLLVVAKERFSDCCCCRVVHLQVLYLGTKLESILLCSSDDDCCETIVLVAVLAIEENILRFIDNEVWRKDSDA
jgi:hypothetical protein